MTERFEPSKMPEVELDPRSIAVVTTTFYPKWYSGEIGDHDLVDKTRGDLAIKTLLKAQSKGFQYVVLDASNQEFQEELGRFGIRVLTERDKGMSASRRQAFRRLVWSKIFQKRSRFGKPFLEKVRIFKKRFKAR